MNLKQLGGWGQTQSSGNGKFGPSMADRCLTLLVEGAAAGVPEMDAAKYRAFRANVDELARRLPDHMPDKEKLALVSTIVREFESYRNDAETALREQVAGWRNLVSVLFGEVLAHLGVDAASADAAPLLQRTKLLTTAEDIEDWRERLDLYLHPANGNGPAAELAARLKAADRTTANDNAAGLRGAGSAVEHVREIMDAGEDGFVVVFKLSCLDIISQRFGPEAVEDCLMAVSAFLTAGLESDDAIYHWSDTALLAILRGRYSEFLVSADLERIISQNRESSINVAGRAIMLRIPISFEITPINRLRSADDLMRISANQAAKR